MAGRIVSRAAALGVAVAAAIGAGGAVAAGAGGLEGSPDAVRLAQHVLTHARHVAALQWRQGGDQWECPASGGPIVGPAVNRPARNCRRATVTFDENLRHGLIVRSLTTTVATGMATRTELITGSGDWTRAGRARCWDAEGAGLINTPAFSYAGEKLSITAQTPSVISLHGVGPGFRETDAIDAHTFAVREVDVRVPAFGGTAKLVATFAEMARPFALPRKPSRVCPEIVRFPHSAPADPATMATRPPPA
ncbi:MAG TPA: hypothetical protein VNV17_26280 [Solirubrobacteraceae bacterium]|nr:hypothetical protein [Solirubrobacteraceae bacterium]